MQQRIKYCEGNRFQIDFMRIWQATLTDWCIDYYPEIYKAAETTESVFAKQNCGRQVALFGRAKNDPRCNTKTGEFTDGHTLVTGPIIKVVNNKYHTADTIYTLEEALKNTDFKRWCEDNQYKEVPLSGVWDKVEQGDMVLRHICEACGKEQVLRIDDAYRLGWDYPPKMGSFRIISPRTCPDCSIKETLWWEITYNMTPPEQLSEQHRATLKRILTEPESIIP